MERHGEGIRRAGAVTRAGDVTERAVHFDDGAAYERFMGRWSRALGATFIDWIGAALPPQIRATLAAAVRALLPVASDGRIIYSARANAVKGRLPG